VKELKKAAICLYYPIGEKWGSTGGCCIYSFTCKSGYGIGFLFHMLVNFMRPDR